MIVQLWVLSRSFFILIIGGLLFSAAAQAECRPGMACFRGGGGGFNSMPQTRSGGCRSGMSCGQQSMGGFQSSSSQSSGACRYGENQDILICADGTLHRGADNVFRKVQADQVNGGNAAPATSFAPNSSSVSNAGPASTAPAPSVSTANSTPGLRSLAAPNSVEPRVPCRLEQNGAIMVCQEGVYARGRDGVYRPTQNVTFASSGRAPLSSNSNVASHGTPTTSAAPAIAQSRVAPARAVAPKTEPVKSGTTASTATPSIVITTPPPSTSIPAADPVDSLELALLGMKQGEENKTEIMGQKVQRLGDDSFVICTGEGCSQPMTLAQIKGQLRGASVEPDRFDLNETKSLLAGMGLPFPTPSRKPGAEKRPFLRVVKTAEELDAAIKANANPNVVVIYSDPDNCPACRSLEGKPRTGDPVVAKEKQLESIAARYAGKVSFIMVDLDKPGSELYRRFQNSLGAPFNANDLPFIPFSVLYDKSMTPVQVNGSKASSVGPDALSTMLTNSGL